jgi:hypothetical protein
VLDLRRTLSQDGLTSDYLIPAQDDVEDALFDIEHQLNWRGPKPVDEIDAANAVLEEANVRLEELLASELSADQ